MLLFPIMNGCYQSYPIPTQNGEIQQQSKDNQIVGVLTSTQLVNDGYHGTLNGKTFNAPNGTIVVDNITIAGCFYEIVDGSPQYFVFPKIGSRYSVQYIPDLSAKINTYALRRMSD
jgi:hypothetical protein